MRGRAASVVVFWLMANLAPQALADVPATSSGPVPAAAAAPPAGPSPWRLRLEGASSYEFRRERTNFQPRVQFAWTAAPHVSLQFGLGVEGAGFGLRVHGETVGGWELWADINAGLIGYSSIEGVLLGASAGVGVSLRVNERFLIGPFMRYAHAFRTTSWDSDFSSIGLQLDFHIDRRAHRRARP